MWWGASGTCVRPYQCYPPPTLTIIETPNATPLAVVLSPASRRLLMILR